MTPGWIALDIDGTLTFDPYTIPSSTIEYLEEVVEKGWKIAFVTGRTARFALMALSKISFPFLLIPQNGTGVLMMPEKKVLFTHYLSFDAVKEIEDALIGTGTDFVIYLGFDKDDRCLYRKVKFSSEIVKILEDWQVRQKEVWQNVDEFPSDISTFASAKMYGRKEKIQELKEILMKKNLFHVTTVRDLYNPGWEILFVTHPLASKGACLEEALKSFGSVGKIIAAGDDDNDSSLFEKADYSIAMPHAPKKLIELADRTLRENESLISALKEVTG